MEGLGDLAWFAGVMALGQFSPGPDMVLLTRTALAEGRRAGVATALGIATGLAVHATAALAGVAIVLQRHAWLREGLMGVAAVYLLWLAWRIAREVWRARKAAGESVAAGVRRTRGPFVRGLLCNLLNPKAALFLAALSTPFLAGERPGWWPLALWIVIVGQGGLLWALWAALLQWRPLREGYRRAARWIDAAFAAALAGLAVVLGIELLG